MTRFAGEYYYCVADALEQGIEAGGFKRVERLTMVGDVTPRCLVVS